jgi:hypothetical protein
VCGQPDELFSQFISGLSYIICSTGLIFKGATGGAKMRENKPLAEAILRQPGQGVGLIFLQERKG